MIAKRMKLRWGRVSMLLDAIGEVQTLINFQLTLTTRSQLQLSHHHGWLKNIQFNLWLADERKEERSSSELQLRECHLQITTSINYEITEHGFFDILCGK